MVACMLFRQLAGLELELFFILTWNSDNINQYSTLFHGISIFRRNLERSIRVYDMMIITSRVSGRGYRNGAVCVSVCVCVCVCVCLLALSQLNRSTYGHEIWHRG